MGSIEWMCSLLFIKISTKGNSSYDVIFKKMFHIRSYILLLNSAYLVDLHLIFKASIHCSAHTQHP